MAVSSVGVSQISEFDFRVVHRDGAKSGNVDCLSRLNLDFTESYDEGRADTDSETLLHLVHHERGGKTPVPDEMNTTSTALDSFVLPMPRDEETWTTCEWAIH